MEDELRILIVSENATDEFGGESVLPLHYFRFLLEKKQDVYLITHSRVKKRLQKIISVESMERVIFIPETFLHSWLHEIGKRLTPRIRSITTNALSHLVTQYFQWVLARKAIRNFNINIVHEPAPVSPKKPSSLFFLGAPVVIGPMNGGMNFPPGFSYMESKGEKYLYLPMRLLAHLINIVLPGKLFAKRLLVANRRTEDALPKFTKGKRITLIENAVDINTWKKFEHEDNHQTVDFVFLGRLTDWKCCNLLIESFKTIQQKYPIRLIIIGDGEEMDSLQKLASSMLNDKVIIFTGWLSPVETNKILSQSQVLVLPSVRECGGAVVLEAMSLSMPVIAVNWGGPADYITSETGILIEPEGPDQLVRDLSSAMERMINNPSLRKEMGDAGYKRLIEHFTWQEKINQIIGIYKQVIMEKP